MRRGNDPLLTQLSTFNVQRSTLNFSKWSERQDFHLRPPGPRPGALKTELRSVKMVSAERFALPVPPPRTEDVAATPRAVCPGDLEGAGGLVRLDPDTGILGNQGRGRMADPKGLAPSAFPQTTGCFSIQLREQTLEIKRAGSARILDFQNSLRTNRVPFRSKLVEDSKGRRFAAATKPRSGFDERGAPLYAGV